MGLENSNVSCLIGREHTVDQIEGTVRAGIPTPAIQVGREVEFEIGAPYAIGKKPHAVRIKLLEIPTAGLIALNRGGE